MRCSRSVFNYQFISVSTGDKREIAISQEIACRADGERELMEALKEMGVKKMGHRQTIVGAVVGKL